MAVPNIGIDNLHLLFQRPNEPVFTKKDNGQAVFELPADFYTERYQSITTTLAPRHGELNVRTIPVRSIPLPDLQFTKTIQRHGPFSLFSRKHQEIAGQLIQVFVDVTNADALLDMAAYVRDRVNPYLFQVKWLQVVFCCHSGANQFQLVCLSCLVCAERCLPASARHKRRELANDLGAVPGPVCGLVGVSACPRRGHNSGAR